ncbi:MAG: hypothetical protein H6662_18700 [Ardenticatenaceae bacterium]|nr:hypothetical protein [Ardenticatenaceae bacterium]MCB8991840.1 hypothetical protein [Ardenticatenaceae bacterium]
MVEEGTRFELSDALRAAQVQLMALRQERQNSALPQRAKSDGRPLPPPSAYSPKTSTLPAHLGWDSPAITAVLQKTAPLSTPSRSRTPLPQSKPITQPPAPSPTTNTLKIYPDVALGMLQAEKAATGRIWLLLRHLDSQGRGWINIEVARKRLAERPSPLRVCGNRQLRNLLAQGEGVFWQMGNGRIWLRSVAKVAAALGVWRLTGRPVALPIAVLTQGMGKVRAHLYASFHSGRQKSTPAPIARATLQQLTCVHPRTQRRYERQARVRKQANYAIGQQANTSGAEHAAWQHGRAAFHLKDVKGLQGQRGATYLAWQLPNQYTGPHQPQPKGRQKRINRELADLFRKGMTGNSVQTVAPFQAKRFFGNGKQAAQAYSRNAQRDVYWPGESKHSMQFWYMLNMKRDA